jgi:hypothetical protein
MENEIPGRGRIPNQTDLVALCRALNQEDARYVVIGGFAIIHHGFIRATEDVDLLIDADADNQARVKKALELLPQKAILELGEDDFRRYTVVRVSDEVLVDVMTAACGIDYKEASEFIEVAHVQGVPIPFATAQLLLRMKQTHRESDAVDRIFLYRKIAEQEKKTRDS